MFAVVRASISSVVSAATWAVSLPNVAVVSAATRWRGRHLIGRQAADLVARGALNWAVVGCSAAAENEPADPTSNK
jgi:hypothetical protein